MPTRHLSLVAAVLAAGAIQAGVPSDDRLAITTALRNIQTSKGILGLRTLDDVKALRATTDEKGIVHVRLSQTFRGVPVWNGHAICHMDSVNEAEPMTDRLVRGFDLSITPSIGTSEALALAAMDMAPVGTWTQVPQISLVAYPMTRRTLRPKVPPESANASDVVSTLEGVVLAYHVHLEIENGSIDTRHVDYLLNAHTGGIIEKWSTLRTVAGTGKSQYSGNVTLSTTPIPAGGFELRDTNRGTTLAHPGTGKAGNATYDLAGQEPDDVNPPILTGTIFTDLDNQWGDGLNHSDSSPNLDNGQTAAVDAHYGLQTTWDYYQKVHGWNGIDGKGTAAINRIHYGRRYANAFWSDSCFCMTYGDGDDSTGTTGFRTVTALDVAGHEMSHGVCTSTADLNYSGEAGGLNEANSDIHGTMVEFYARGGGTGTTVPDTGGNWTIAEQLNLAPLRNMIKPSKDGRSPNAWTLGMGSLDPHFSSGPMNRCFYFMSAGSSPDSTQDSYSSYLPTGMTGIGNTKAIRIWFKAMKDYLTPGSNYHDARIACQNAATALYGAGSPELAVVQNAFHGINVGPSAGLPDDISPPTNVTVSVLGSSEIIIFTGSAIDDVKVERIEFQIDGATMAKVDSGNGSAEMDSHLLVNGLHSLKAVAFDSSGNRSESAVMPFTIVNAYTQVLGDPGFELKGSGWRIKDNAGVGLISALAHSGQAFGVIGGAGSTGLSVSGSMAQTVTIPDIEKPTLSFWFWIASADKSGTVHDTMKVQLYDETGALLLATLEINSNTDSATTDLVATTPAFVQHAFDLSAYKGKTVTLKLTADENADSLATLFRVDDFFLGFQWSNPDQNDDGIIDGIDLGILAQAYNSGAFPTPTPLSDLNNDGRVDVLDVALLMKQFGQKK